MELLTVISIIALVGGLGAGAYQLAYRSYSLAATAGRIQGVIRAARNASISTGIPSFVVADPVARTVAAYGYERVGEWSFDLPEGDPVAELGPGRYTNRGGSVVPGRVGSAMSFQESGGYVDCGAEARFQLRTTVHVEAWVRHQLFHAVPPPSKEAARRSLRQTTRGARGGRSGAPRDEAAAAILEKSGAYFLGMTSEGALDGAIGEYRARTAPGVVLPGRWVHVALRFDGKELELSVDGVPRRPEPPAGPAALRGKPSAPLPEIIPTTSSAVTISSPGSSFPGEIDEVKLSGGVEPFVYELADYERIVGWKKVIHFDRFGHLDPRYHGDAVRLVLVELGDEEYAGSSKTVVAVDYSVTFEEWLARWDQPPAMTQAEEEGKLEVSYGNARKVAVEVDRLGVVR